MVRPCGSKTEGFKVTNTRARIWLVPSTRQLTHLFRRGAHRSGWRLRRQVRCAEDAGENVVDVAKLLVEIEGALGLRRGEDLGNVGIGEQEAFEITPFGERSHRVALNPLVGLLARD